MTEEFLKRIEAKLDRMLDHMTRDQPRLSTMTKGRVVTEEELFKQINTKLDWLLNDMRDANHRIAQVTFEVINTRREAGDASGRLRRIEERLSRIEKSLDIEGPDQNLSPYQDT